MKIVTAPMWTEIDENHAEKLNGGNGGNGGNEANNKISNSENRKAKFAIGFIHFLSYINYRELNFVQNKCFDAISYIKN